MTLEVSEAGCERTKSCQQDTGANKFKLQPLPQRGVVEDLVQPGTNFSRRTTVTHMSRAHQICVLKQKQEVFIEKKGLHASRLVPLSEFAILRRHL